jgi:hypothetical protein
VTPPRAGAGGSLLATSGSRRDGYLSFARAHAPILGA